MKVTDAYSSGKKFLVSLGVACLLFFAAAIAAWLSPSGGVFASVALGCAALGGALTGIVAANMRKKDQ